MEGKSFPSGPQTVVVVSVTVLVLVAAAVTVSLWARYVTEVDTAGTGLIGSDYRTFVTAGEQAAERDATGLYGDSVYDRVDTATYLYAPWFAVMIIPAGALDLQVGYWAWMIAGLLLACAALWTLSRRVGLVFFVIAALSAPGLQTFYYGQTVFFMMGMAALTLIGAQHERHTMAGLSLSLMALKPQLVLGVGLVWLRRCRDPLVRAAIASIALMLVAVVIVPGVLRHWVRAVVEFDTTFSAWEVNVSSAVEFALGETAGGTLMRVAVAIAGFAWLLSVVARRGWEPVPLLFAGFGMAISFGPHALTYSTLIVVPFLAVMWEQRYVDRTALTLFGLGALALVSLGPILTVIQVDQIGRAIALGPIAFAALVVWTTETCDIRAKEPATHLST